MKWISRGAWQWAYQLEEVREQAQADRQLIRQAFACIGLALLSPWEGR